MKVFLPYFRIHLPRFYSLCLLNWSMCTSQVHTVFLYQPIQWEILCLWKCIIQFWEVPNPREISNSEWIEIWNWIPISKIEMVDACLKPFMWIWLLWWDRPQWLMSLPEHPGSCSATLLSLARVGTGTSDLWRASKKTSSAWLGLDGALAARSSKYWTLNCRQHV